MNRTKRPIRQVTQIYCHLTPWCLSMTKGSSTTMLADQLLTSQPFCSPFVMLLEIHMMWEMKRTAHNGCDSCTCSSKLCSKMTNRSHFLFKWIILLCKMTLETSETRHLWERVRAWHWMLWMQQCIHGCRIPVLRIGINSVPSWGCCWVFMSPCIVGTRQCTKSCVSYW